MIDIHVGADAAGDVAEVAALLREASREEAATARCGIRVHAHAGCGHEVPLCLKQAGKLEALLLRWVCDRTAHGRGCSAAARAGRDA